jgi:hypothetical protein
VGPRTLTLAAFGLLAIGAAGCGSGGAGSSSGNSSGLVAKVSHAEASVSGGNVDASADVKEGGKPGERLTLRYGLVDAISGVRASKEEQLVASYTTTRSVESKTAKIHFKTPTNGSAFLVHFALYAPDGSWLSSSDSPVFNVS